MSTVEETLAREAERRPRAGAAAIAAGVLGLAGNLLGEIIRGGEPTEKEGFISLPDALNARLEGAAADEPSRLVKLVDHAGDNVVPLTASTLLVVASVALLAIALIYLFRATVARAESTGRLPVIAVVAGASLFCVGRLVREMGTWIPAAGFEDERVRTAQSAADVLGSPLVLSASLLEILGSFGIGLGIALVALNAMRVGLLTRFLGILGIFVGVLAIFQVDAPQVVRAFWLVAVGLLILGRVRSGLLPAWQTGRAHPWPSQQQIREARLAASGGGGAAASSPPDPEPDPQRRKRKRRK